MIQQEAIIKNYIDGYNSFDIAQMLRDLVEDVYFENISNGVVTDSLNGKKEFGAQAELAKDVFSQRKQTITNIEQEDNKWTVWIDYEATLAIDVSESAKIGDQFQLKGQSIFEFNQNNQIILIKDIS